MTKFFDILIDDRLNWKEHISLICSKLSKCVAIIYKAKQWGPVTFNAPDGAGTQLRYSPRTAARLRLRCHCHFINDIVL